MPSPVAAQTALAVQSAPYARRAACQSCDSFAEPGASGLSHIRNTTPAFTFPFSLSKVSFDFRPAISTTSPSSAISSITTEDHQSAAAGANIDPEKQGILEADTALAAEAACGSHDQGKFSPTTSSSISN